MWAHVHSSLVRHARTSMGSSSRPNRSWSPRMLSAYIRSRGRHCDGCEGQRHDRDHRRDDLQHEQTLGHAHDALRKGRPSPFPERRRRASASPVRLLISRLDSRSTRCMRLISAHCSTPTTHPSSSPESVGHISTGGDGALFRRRPQLPLCALRPQCPPQAAYFVSKGGLIWPLSQPGRGSECRSGASLIEARRGRVGRRYRRGSSGVHRRVRSMALGRRGVLAPDLLLGVIRTGSLVCLGAK
jgi:hypothetical protein